MANAEHVKIVKAGKKSIDEWRKKNIPKPHLDLSGITISDLNLIEANLAGANLRGTTIEDSCLEEAVMCCVDLRCANLKNLSINNANLGSSDLRYAHFEGSYFMGAELDDCDARGAYFNKTLLKGASLMWSWFSSCDFSGADLEFVRLHKTNFYGARFDGAKLSPFDNSQWVINKVSCTHFFLDGERIPKEGYLRTGEFEDRFKSRPTIEFCFEFGMRALDPAVLSIAIDEANLKNPKAGLRLLDISARGGLPRAIIEIAERMPKVEALILVQTCYQQILAEMQKEIEGLKNDKKVLINLASRKLFLPSMESVKDKWIRITDAAIILGVAKGTISRWADDGIILDNGKKKRERRVSKLSVLSLKHKREHEDVIKDATDYLQDRASKISDRH